MTTGWVCAICGSSNAPLLLQCPCSNSVAASGGNTDARSGKSVAAPSVAGSGSSKATATTRKRHSYNDPWFRAFWEEYPLHKGKLEAARAFAAVVAEGADPEQIVAGAKAYARDPSRNPAKTKHAEGWLRGKRWEDEPVQLRHPLAAVEDTDPALIVGTPEWDERQHAEEEAAIRRTMEGA